MNSAHNEIPLLPGCLRSLDLTHFPFREKKSEPVHRKRGLITNHKSLFCFALLVHYLLLDYFLFISNISNTEREPRDCILRFHHR